MNLQHLQHWSAPTWDFSRIAALGSSAPITAGAFGATSAGHASFATSVSQSQPQSNYDLPEPSVPGTPFGQHKERAKKRHTILRKPVNRSQDHQGSSASSSSPRISDSSSDIEFPSPPKSQSLKESQPKLVRRRPLQSDGLLPREPPSVHERMNKRRKERRLVLLNESHPGSRDPRRATTPQKDLQYDPESVEESALVSSPNTTTTDTSNNPVGDQTVLTCISCASDLPAEEFSESPLTQSCDHPHSACKDCVKQWIETQLGDGSWSEIKCLECNETMEYGDVQRHADAEVFRRYDAMSARSWLNNEENFVWCRNQGCGFGQVHEGGKNLPLFQCMACMSRFCIVHEEPWHEGETCAAFDRRMNGEDPVEEGEPSDQTTAHQSIRERRQKDMTFAEANDLQDRRLYDQARHRRTRTSAAQLARDFNAALALQYAEEEASDYESTFSKYRPPQSEAERLYFGHSTEHPPTGRRRRVQQFFNHRTTRRRDLDEGPLSYIRQNSIQLTQDEELARSLQELPANDASYPRSAEEEYEQYERDRRVAAGKKARRQRAVWQTVDDAALARDLQKQFEQEDINRRATVEREAEHHRSVREADDPAAMRQSASDAKTARALQDEFGREERERVQQRQRYDQTRQDREAYRRRKAEENAGEQTVRSNAKQCPSCRWYIQKNDGCDHVSSTSPPNSQRQKV